MSIRKHHLGVAIGCALLLGSTTASAGSKPTPENLPQQTTDSAAPANQDAKQDNVTKLGQIPVTAQSRTQEVQDVPIAMDIVTAKAIDTVAATDLSGMNMLVPGLVVDSTDPTTVNPCC